MHGILTQYSLKIGLFPFLRKRGKEKTKDGTFCNLDDARPPDGMTVMEHAPGHVLTETHIHTEEKIYKK